jgi:sec-independent protein translocase protein TatB
MFNIGPFELVVLAIVGLIVLGPDRLPSLARDAARMIKTLREMATGAREQLRDELGPEFADVDLRNLNPRTAVQRAVFGDEINLSKLNPRTAVRDAIFGDEDLRAADPRTVLRETSDAIRNGEPKVSMDKPVTIDKPVTDKPVTIDKPMTMDKLAATDKPAANGNPASNGRPRPGPGNGVRPDPTASAPYDDDAT